MHSYALAHTHTPATPTHNALGLHDITFFTPRYIITHDATILLNIVQKVAIQLGKGRGKARYN